MPVKRTAGKRRLDHLTLNQESHLRCGSYLFPGPHPECAQFENEAHRREAWERHRDLVMHKEHPGCRPAAFWDYDCPRPAGAVSQSYAVYLLPDTTPVERAAIEAEWRHQITVALTHTSSVEAARDYAGRCDYRGVPPAFFDAHAPAIKAKNDAERASFWTGLEKRTNGHA